MKTPDKQTNMTLKTENPPRPGRNLLGNYEVYADDYFDQTYYLINKFGTKAVEFRVRDFFDDNRPVSLNAFLRELRTEGFEVNDEPYKRITVYNRKDKKYYIDWYLFLNKEHIIINIERNGVKKLSDVRFYFNTATATEDVSPDDLLRIFECAARCQTEIEDEKRYISIMGKTPYGELMLKQRELKPVSILDPDLYYGEGFAEKHQRFVDLMNDRDKSGLLILHGITGSGKTNYIRHLISSGKPGIKYIFYPVSSLREIAGPSLISFLIDYKNSVLIIEESEESVGSRDGRSADKSLIANLLNVSDGLLSDVLNLKIICTFNTDLRNLDNALLREGRLLGIHKFTKISSERAERIAKMNNLERSFDEEVTLSQVFNSSLKDDMSDLKEAKKIGF